MIKSMQPWEAIQNQQPQQKYHHEERKMSLIKET